MSIDAQPSAPVASVPYDTAPSVVVVGGGLTGLTAAYTLQQQGYSVRLIESAPRFGGVIQSHWHQGFLLESGPNSFMSTASHLMALVADLGLKPLPTSASAKKRFIWHQNRLKPVPMGPGDAVTTDLLSPWAKLRLLCEPWQPPRPLKLADESLAQFIKRRLGNEVLEALVGPFVSGIYAGDPAQMSAQAVFPKLTGWEQQSGSLVRGALQQRASARQANPTGKAVPKPKYQLLSFEQGLQVLTEALVAALPAEAVQLDTTVLSLQTLTKGGYRLICTDTSSTSTRQTFDVSQVVLATPADVTAGLIHDLLPAVDASLTAVPYAPMTVVHVGVPFTKIPQVLAQNTLDGFGCLIPRTCQGRPVGIPTLGMIFSSSLFANRAPEGHALLTCFIGGATQPEVAQWRDEQCLSQVLQDVQTVLGIPPSAPTMTHVTRWAKAIPQYACDPEGRFDLGHVGRIQSVQMAIQPMTGLTLAGNYMDGVSLNDCVRQGRQAAERVSQQLAMH
jgi:oxygen-dependent protoporphyrinogen oxidase